MIDEHVQFPAFVQHMHDLYDYEDDPSDEDQTLLLSKFMHYALTGQLRSTHNHPEQTVQYSVLLDRNNITEELAEQVESVRDYDSLIGFSNNLPYTVALSLHLIPQSIYQLKNSLHVYVDRNLVEPVMVCV